MKIKIHVDRAAALAVGNEQYGPQVVEVALEAIPEELRGELASLFESGGVTDATEPVDGSSRDDDPRLVIERASVEAVIAALAHREAVRADRMHRKAAERDARIAQALAAPDDDWFDRDSSGEAYYLATSNGAYSASASGYTYRRPCVADEPIGPYLGMDLHNDPRILAHRERLERDVLPAKLREWERRYAEWRRVCADREARAQAGLERLREWTLAHGSERVRKMLALEFTTWMDVAEHEFRDAHAPASYTHGCRAGDDRRKPTLPELQELERLRALCEQSDGVLSEPGLRWIVEEAEYDEESGEETPERRYCVATVRVTAPTGESACYDREIEPV